MDANSISRPACKVCCRDQTRLSSTDWQARYDAGKTGWDRGEPNPMLGRWMASGELQPGKILVPGCGRGHEVIALAEAGFEVTAIDFADAAVQSLSDELKRRDLKANVVQKDVFAYCPSRSFDAVYEQTSLCAIHPSQWATYQQLLACWLRSGGQLFALFMQSGTAGGPPYSCELDTMHELFAKPTWHWSDSKTRVEHPTGMHEIACVLARKETNT
ncbi:tellurite resistance protein TehB [Rosistilla oblonga]|uniref:methyltransferase domain-containing protein n=1 Tax=Rosistilla oblonga TaxID=2527990 RepID=UPI00118BC05A|nr:methyltransferase domain-containing protein [Rosistilla oblonga]QDV13073.1 tellurite resistance protein TehB [Rosistilla oblonga]